MADALQIKDDYSVKESFTWTLSAVNRKLNEGPSLLIFHHLLILVDSQAELLSVPELFISSSKCFYSAGRI